MAVKKFERTIKHRWHTSQAGVSASVRKKGSKRVYRKVVQDAQQTYEAEFRVVIDLKQLVDSVIGQATRSNSLRAVMFRGLARAECIQRRDLGIQVIPLPLDEDEELVRDDTARS